MMIASARKSGVADVDLMRFWISPAWRLHVILMTMLLLTVAVFYWDTFSSLVDTWQRSSNFEHSVVVVPISLYMVWTCRNRLYLLQPRVNAWGLLLVCALTASWLFARAADVLVVQQFSIVAIVPALVLASLGAGVCRAIAFPLAYLVLAVPVWDVLVPPMMDLTAQFTTQALRFSGVPVLMEGRYITVPSGDWEVARACSGVRYLIASVTLGSIYAYFSYKSYWRRAFFLLLATIIPIIANWIRAYGIVMIGHLSDMQLAVGVDHVIGGWLFFGLVMLLLFWLGSRWTEPRHLGVSLGGSSRQVVPDSVQNRSLVITVTITTFLILVGGALLGRDLLESDRTAVGGVAIQTPPAKTPWSGPFETDDSWQPRLINADGFAKSAYRYGDRDVDLYFGFYLTEQQGAELINSENRFFGDELWRRVAEDRQTISLNNGGVVTVHESRIQDRGNTKLVWHWYHVAGYSTPSPIVAKLLGAWGKLSRQRSGSTLVAIATDIEIGPETARQTLGRFLNSMRPNILATLRQAEKTH